MSDNPVKDPRKVVVGQTIVEIGDPWIEAYLRMRQAMLDREISTIADAEDWAATARRALPREGPSVTAAMFITADITISFPEGDTSSDADLMTALWIPR